MPIAVHRDSGIRNLRIPTLAQMIREAQEFSKPRLKRLTCEALLEWFNQSERLWIARTHYHLRGPRFIDFGERIGVDQSSAYQLVKLIPYKARILARCADEGRYYGWETCLYWYEKPPRGRHQDRDAKQEYGTPPAIFRRFGTRCTLDVCATSEAVMVPDASIAFAAVTLMASNAGGRPPIRPRARLAASAVRVRSRRSSTSNCPSAAKMCRISRPVALVVSMFSCSDRRPMPRAASVSTVVRSWRIDRARRSSRATTSTSPSRANAKAAASCGRSARVPLIDFSNTRSHPAAWRASICPSVVVCRPVETRA
jgi:hypothetical protein